MSETNYVKKETFEQMRAELYQMKSVERPAASRAIAEAREKGDLKENAEYDAAKEAQGMLEAKIKYLEGVIATARILDETNIDTSKVSMNTSDLNFRDNDIYISHKKYIFSKLSIPNSSKFSKCSNRTSHLFL